MLNGLAGHNHAHTGRTATMQTGTHTATREADAPAAGNFKLISEMQEGDEGWTAPWAMRLDQSRNPWLLARFRVYDQPGGDNRMRVRLHPDGGFHAWPPAGHRYEPDRRSSQRPPVRAVIYVHRPR